MSYITLYLANSWQFLVPVPGSRDWISVVYEGPEWKKLAMMANSAGAGNTPMAICTQRNLFEILLNQTEINGAMVNTIWFLFDWIRFRKKFSVCTHMSEWQKLAMMGNFAGAGSTPMAICWNLSAKAVNLYVDMGQIVFRTNIQEKSWHHITEKIILPIHITLNGIRL